jgi:hypothetical protein
MSAFWKSNSPTPEQNQEEAVSFEEPPDGDGDLALPEEASSSDAVVVKIPESKNEEEQNSSEAAGSTSEQRAAEKFKSSMKNMGKLFAFR